MNTFVVQLIKLTRLKSATKNICFNQPRLIETQMKVIYEKYVESSCSPQIPEELSS